MFRAHMNARGNCPLSPNIPVRHAQHEYKMKRKEQSGYYTGRYGIEK